MGVPPGSNVPDVLTAEQIGETNGANRHMRVMRILAMLFDGNGTGGYEYIVVDNILYLHGPVSPSLAPENKWYIMEKEKQYIDTLGLADTLDRIAKSTNNWSRFEKARSGESLDGQTCDVYSAGQTGAIETLSGLFLSTSKLVTDQATATVVVCNNKYLHRLTTTWSGYAPTEPTRKANATIDLHFYDFNANIAIQAPPNVTPPATRTPIATPGK